MPKFWRVAAAFVPLAVLSIASDLILMDLDGKRVEPFAAPAPRATVFIFTRSDCPISNRYAPELERLYGKFRDRDIRFSLVYIDPDESSQVIRRHIEEYGYHMGVLLDPRHHLVSMVKATVTPEAAVYVGDRLLYRGRVDNRYASVSTQRRVITAHDLEDVLQAIADGRSVQPSTTRAVGCVIEGLK